MAPIAKSSRVVIADDNVDSVDALAELLRLDLPPVVEVVVAHDGDEALAAALAVPLAWAVVVDVDMHCVSGIEVAATIRRRDERFDERTTLVAMSGDDGLLDAARQSGHFDRVLRKPIDLPVLLKALVGHSLKR